MNLRRLVPMPLRYKIMDIRGRGIYSLYADDYKSIFIHIPKTAGVSISETLFNQRTTHYPYFEYESANKKKFDEYFKFTFVRNPWDRLVSTFFFLKKGGLGGIDAEWANENLNKYSSFDEFVKAWVNDANVWSWVHFVPQHYFVYDKEFNIKVDFVGKLERINQDFSYVANKLKCSKQLPKSNTSSHIHYSRYYSEETKAIVANVYAKDIELFDYTFDCSEKD